MLVVLEGIDGCGKSTVAREMAWKLGWNSMEFPDRTTVTGRVIDEYLKGNWRTHAISPESGEYSTESLAFQALQICNRLEHVTRLREAREGRVNLILARYMQSGIVYGGLDGLPTSWLEQMSDALPEPQLNILLDVPADIAIKRRFARDGAAVPERYEGKIEFCERVRQRYISLWGSRSMTRGLSYRIVNATRSFDEVVAECMREREDEAQRLAIESVREVQGV